MEIQEIINLFLIENSLEELSQTQLYNSHADQLMQFAENQGEEIVYDSVNEEFIKKDDSIYCLLTGQSVYVNANEDVIFFNGEAYLDTSENINYYDIVYTYDGEYDFSCDCIYGIIDRRGNEGWFSDSEDYVSCNGIHYLNDEIAEYRGVIRCSSCDEFYNSNHDSCCDEDNEDESYTFDYHSDYRADKTTPETKFMVGFEVEKEDEGVKREETAYELFQSTGWAKEKDGSLNDESGFELVSPTFDLFDETIKESFDKVEKYLNAGHSKACGGHINYSIAGLKPSQVLKTVEGYLPLLYAMYEKRIGIHFCKAKKADLLYSDRDKYQSVALKDNRIEFRIFSAVKTRKHLEWRLELMKIFANNPRPEVHQVLKDVCDKQSALRNHLDLIFSEDQVKEKINLFIKYSLEIEEIGLKNLVNEAFEFDVNAKIEVKEKPKSLHDRFKVGDKVRVLYHNDATPHMREGMEVLIYNVSPGSPLPITVVNINGGCFANSNSVYFLHPDQIEVLQILQTTEEIFF